MKKILLLSTAGMLLIAASCTKNEVVEVNQDGNEIQYSVVANKATKAADIYCNNNMPASFTVYAESENATYIKGDNIVRQDDGSWKNVTGTRFWPEAAVDFYAIVDGDMTWDPSVNAPATIKDFSVSTEVAKQNDLLYAVKKNQSKGEGTDDKSAAANTNPVELNFRHALSQIVFNAKNTNPNLYVEISGVSIVNVGEKNSFTFPTADTDNNLEDTDHDGVLNTTVDYSDGSWGVWNSLDGGSTVYPVTFGPTPVEYNADKPIVDLTTAYDVKNEYSSKAMLLLPQTVKAWDPETIPFPGFTGKKENGSYFLVNCAIYNIADKDAGFVAPDPEKGVTGDVPLWGGVGAHEQVAIPVDINWEQGKKYIYTFVFGEGGGYDPDDPDPGTDPDPVLIPVTFEVSVDDFVYVDVDPDIDMNPEA